MHGRDKYQRTLGDVLLPDGMNLNQELVRQGLCWWYRKYTPGDTVLEGLEKKARATKIGLWADPGPYRRGRGTVTSSRPLMKYIHFPIHRLED
jgi:endonuclease YncB( thermonuclease family)